ncbi:3767_t:CDS:2, partial [Acaulospora colombiana]
QYPSVRRPRIFCLKVRYSKIYDSGAGNSRPCVSRGESGKKLEVSSKSTGGDEAKGIEAIRAERAAKKAQGQEDVAICSNLWTKRDLTEDRPVSSLHHSDKIFLTIMDLSGAARSRDPKLQRKSNRRKSTLKASTEKAAPRKSAARSTVSRKGAPKALRKAAPKGSTPKKAAQKAAPRKTTQKTAPKEPAEKSVPRKATVKAAAPKGSRSEESCASSLEGHDPPRKRPPRMDVKVVKYTDILFGTVEG